MILSKISLQPIQSMKDGFAKMQELDEENLKAYLQRYILNIFDIHKKDDLFKKPVYFLPDKFQAFMGAGD